MSYLRRSPHKIFGSIILERIGSLGNNSIAAEMETAAEGAEGAEGAVILKEIINAEYGAKTF
jgi:hypothetical protein